MLADAVRAAFVEGLARGEATDAAAARTWANLTFPARPADAATRRWLAEVIRGSHGAPFDPARIPVDVRQRLLDWLGGEHGREPLRSYPAWPTVAPPPHERRVVLLRALRPEDDSADAATLAGLAHVLGTRDVRSYELRTDQCRQAAERTGIIRTTVRVAGDVTDSPSLAATYRRVLRKRLGRDREAKLADEVAVLVPAGFKALSMAALLAAVDWSLHVAAPLTVLSFAPRERAKQGSGPVEQLITGEETRAFATLGVDRRLAKLARAARDRLDLALAADLLEECRDVFVDTSTNRSRRYCSDGCANRANVRAHRNRRRLR